MAEGFAGRDAIAQALLQLFRLGKSPLRLARPDQIAGRMDLENAAAAGAQRHPGQFRLEAGQQLLG